VKTNYVILKIPEATWTFLKATLELDSRSTAFDLGLRKEIQDALDKVATIMSVEM
jgi:hypothetical protein